MQHEELTKDAKNALNSIRLEKERPRKPHEWMLRSILEDAEVVLATLLYHISLVDCTYPTKKIESERDDDSEGSK